MILINIELIIFPLFHFSIQNLLLQLHKPYVYRKLYFQLHSKSQFEASYSIS